jgi:Mannose-6-phosphate isomerase
MIGEKLSPKFLVVAPNKRLSWQYHFRRAEIWRVVSGPIKVAISETDEETPGQFYEDGNIIVLSKGTRHRLIGAPENYGVVAEIWQHTDPEQTPATKMISFDFKMILAEAPCEKSFDEWFSHSTAD